MQRIVENSIVLCALFAHVLCAFRNVVTAVSQNHLNTITRYMRSRGINPLDIPLSGLHVVKRVGFEGASIGRKKTMEVLQHLRQARVGKIRTLQHLIKQNMQEPTDRLCSVTGYIFCRYNSATWVITAIRIAAEHDQAVNVDLWGDEGNLNIVPATLVHVSPINCNIEDLIGFFQEASLNPLMQQRRELGSVTLFICASRLQASGSLMSLSCRIFV